MLHALNADTGAELWAYVPTAVIPNMWRLADFDYPHLYYVDGGPVVGDVYDGSSWRTILVGGLGAGGRAYYALDVTDPTQPKALWEFSVSNSSNLGLTFGNPVITKDSAGNWVVMFSSGYNNVSPGDGKGYLYVLNVITGAQLASTPIATSAGDTTTPSNLGRIVAWTDADTDNTATRVYGGDMLGNVWRFDFDNQIGPSGKESFLLARTLTSGGTPQPITTKPVVTRIKVGAINYDLVTVMTGRLLGTTDVGDTTLQSVYVFKDTLPATGLGSLRSNANMVAQTMAVNGSTRNIPTLNTVDWA
jgi:type IV pilus assembly protein PilY1